MRKGGWIAIAIATSVTSATKVGMLVADVGTLGTSEGREHRNIGMS
jgi:hypothetical protein